MLSYLAHSPRTLHALATRPTTDVTRQQHNLKTTRPIKKIQNNDYRCPAWKNRTQAKSEKKTVFYTHKAMLCYDNLNGDCNFYCYCNNLYLEMNVRYVMLSGYQSVVLSILLSSEYDAPMQDLCSL